MWEPSVLLSNPCLTELRSTAAKANYLSSSTLNATLTRRSSPPDPHKALCLCTLNWKTRTVKDTQFADGHPGRGRGRTAPQIVWNQVRFGYKHLLVLFLRGCFGGSISSWTLFHAHKIRKLCCCTRVMMKEEGVSEGKQQIMTTVSIWRQIIRWRNSWGVFPI